MAGEATHFLNVDLELVTRHEVDALLAHWGALVMLRDSVEDGKRTIWIELEEQYPGADSTLAGFLDLIEALPVPLRQQWDNCDDRCFNIGIQVADAPNAAAFPVASETLRRISDLNGRIEFTVYGSSTETDDRNR